MLGYRPEADTLEKVSMSAQPERVANQCAGLKGSTKITNGRVIASGPEFVHYGVEQFLWEDWFDILFHRWQDGGTECRVET